MVGRAPFGGARRGVPRRPRGVAFVHSGDGRGAASGWCCGCLGRPSREAVTGCPEDGGDPRRCDAEGRLVAMTQRGVRRPLERAGGPAPSALAADRAGFVGPCRGPSGGRVGLAASPGEGVARSPEARSGAARGAARTRRWKSSRGSRIRCLGGPRRWGSGRAPAGAGSGRPETPVAFHGRAWWRVSGRPRIGSPRQWASVTARGHAARPVRRAGYGDRCGVS